MADDLFSYASQQPSVGDEETVAFLLSLREKGIRDTMLLRAMEMTPRDLFAPRRLRDLARADISLPLPCGQTMTAPAIIATMLLALRPAPHHRALEIGTGSGYVSAVLGRMAGHVVSLERYHTLALAASERVAALGLGNVAVLAADGLAAASVEGQQYDRILLNGTLGETFPPALLAALADDGVLVGALAVDGLPHLVRLSRKGEEGLLREDLGPVRMPPLVHGIAAVL